MPTTPDQCANYQINLQMCPCTEESCGNRGVCCECVQAHAGYGMPSACMRGARRNPATMALSRLAVASCGLNRERNLAFCNCTYEPCDRKGTCCNCVRNHFTLDGGGRTACMKALA